VTEAADLLDEAIEAARLSGNEEASVTAGLRCG
jgi:hypothetical protein